MSVHMCPASPGLRGLPTYTEGGGAMPPGRQWALTCDPGALSMRVLIHWTFNPGLFNLVLPAPGRSLYRWAQSTSAWSTGGLSDPPSYVDSWEPSCPGKHFLSSE